MSNPTIDSTSEDNRRFACHNRFGFGLFEMLMAIFIGVLITAAMVTVVKMSFEVYRDVRAYLEVTTLHNEILNLLTPRTLGNPPVAINNCNQNLVGRDIGVPINLNSLLEFIPPGPAASERYKVNNQYGQEGVLTLNDLRVENFKRHMGSLFISEFRASYLRRGQTQPEVLMFHLHLLVDNRNIIQGCRPLAGQTENHWFPSYTTGGQLTLFTPADNIGIGPTMGTVVNGLPFPGSVALKLPPFDPRIEQVSNNGTTARAIGFTGPAPPPPLPVTPPNSYILDIEGNNNNLALATNDLTVGAILTPVWARVGGSASVAGPLRAASFHNPSDGSLKENINPIDHPLETLFNLKGVTYYPKNQFIKNNSSPGSKLPLAGLIAQEVEAVLPSLVRKTGSWRSINYNGIVALLVESEKEVVVKSRDLGDRISILAQRHEEMKKILHDLKKESNDQTPKSKVP